MQMNRKGTYRNGGVDSRALGAPKISWCLDEGSINIDVPCIRGFSSSNSCYDYKFKLDLKDIALIIKTLGDEAPCQSGDAIAKALAPNLREIIRLQNTCVGTTLNTSKDEGQR